MNQKSDENSRPLPGLISTLSAGFELTTHHLWLILLPLFLDIFYWIGPRIGIQNLIAETMSMFADDPLFAELSPMVEVAAQANLFTSLSIPMIGVPALMSGPIPEKTPLTPSIIQIDGLGLWFLLIITLSIIGLFLTSIYLGLISLPLEESEDGRTKTFSGFLIHIIKCTVRLLLLGIIFVVALLVIWLPLMPLAVLLGLIAMSLSAAVMLFGLVAVSLYLSMAVPGIVLGDRPVVQAIKDSLRMVHSNMMPTMSLLLILVVIGSGTNLLWRLADDGSWLTLASLAGHAFVNTALVVTLFIYYKDRYFTLETESPKVGV